MLGVTKKVAKLLLSITTSALNIATIYYLIKHDKHHDKKERA